jgi:FkbH-like protein
LSLADSLGDNGLIGVLFLHKHGAALMIDTWVMSCRVLLRGVEQFTRNELIELTRADGCTHLLGAYIPTAKNGMVKDHYRNLGFESAGEDNDKTYWSLDVTRELNPLEHYITREESNE